MIEYIMGKIVVLGQLRENGNIDWLDNILPIFEINVIRNIFKRISDWNRVKVWLFQMIKNVYLKLIFVGNYGIIILIIKIILLAIH